MKDLKSREFEDSREKERVFENLENLLNLENWQKWSTAMASKCPKFVDRIYIATCVRIMKKDYNRIAKVIICEIN